MIASAQLSGLAAVILPLAVAIMFTSFSGNAQPLEENKSKFAKLIFDYGNHFDVDVVLPGDISPACRLLLEHIHVDGMRDINGIHTRAATWKQSGDELEGSLSLGQGVECTLRLKPTADGVSIRVSLKNTSKDTCRDVRLNICANLCRLPRTHKVEWSNRDFIPESVPLDRTQHGKHWYCVVTPKKLRAWTPGKGWIFMHTQPDNPDQNPKNLYSHVVSKTDDSLGCAVMSVDGKKLFYQVWKAGHSQHQSPFAGNACMHLRPQIAEELAPGMTATIEGTAGIFEGTWEQMAAEFQKFTQPRKSQ